MKKLFTLFLLAILPLVVNARVQINGIYYELSTDGSNTASVMFEREWGGGYSGNIVIPASVTYEEVTYSVTSIGNRAFYNCTGLTSVSIPSTVTSIGNDAFMNCSRLVSVYIDDLEAWCKISFGTKYSNPLYITQQLFINGTRVNDLIIPDGVTSISNYAFCRVAYQGGILYSVTIPSSVSSISPETFAGCDFTAITVDAGNTIYDSRGGCNAIIEKATNKLILGCKNTIIPSTVTSIGDWAFWGCNGLGSMTIPASITSIGKAVFARCFNLQTITVDPGNIVYDSRGGCNAIIEKASNKLISGCVNTIIPNDVISIGESAFSECFVLFYYGPTDIEPNGPTSIDIPNSVTSIGDSAFYCCTSLLKMTIPSSVTFIDKNAFYGSMGLPSVDPDVFEAWLMTYYGTTALPAVHIDDLEAWCKITFADYYSNPLYNAHHLYLNGTEITNLTIPSSVTSLSGWAFANCESITDVSIPSSVTSIGEEAFTGCSGLTSVTIPNSVTSIGDRTFYGCSDLKSVTIGNGVTSIGEYVFSNCSSLASVTIPSSVTSIGNGAFFGCSSLTTAPLHNSMISIGDWAFTSCSGLTSVTIPGSVTSIGEGSFCGCISLASVDIPLSVTSIGDYAFGSCPLLISVTSYIKSLFNIADYTFDDNTYENSTLYVPSGTKTLYKATDAWKKFKNIVETGGVAESCPIDISKSGKVSYCGDKSLDFSFSDEIKAYIATGFDETEGTIWLTRVKDVPAGTPVLIKGEANQTYQVPVTDSKNSYYTNMFKGNISGDKIQVPETENGFVNYYLASDGTFKSVKNYANIGNNKSYLQLPGTFAPAEAGTTQTVTVGASGKASYAAPVDLDFTNVEGLKAFTATGYDKSSKTIWLTRVMKVQKGEGVLLKGEAKDYEIPSVAVQSSYMNMFVGNTSGNDIQVKATSDDGSLTNYYLKGDGTFVSVNGYVNIKNNKCYLALPTSMVSAASTRGEANYILDEPEVIKLPISFRSLDNDGNGTTGINVQSSMVNVQSDNAYYTLQGQRVVNPGKGLYIKNGKKVVIK